MRTDLYVLSSGSHTQTYASPDIYYIAFPNDRPLPKFIVWFLFIVELLQTILVTRDAFNNFGLQYGNVPALDGVGFIWFSVPVVTALGTYGVSCSDDRYPER